jgi:hypothetical protein
MPSRDDHTNEEQLENSGAPKGYKGRAALRKGLLRTGLIEAVYSAVAWQRLCRYFLAAKILS